MKKYLSKKYTKISILNSLSKTINTTRNEDNKLIIHTANGMYIGTLKEDINYENIEVKEDDDLLTVYRKIYLKTINDYENSDMPDRLNEISENHLSITLENVELITNMKTISLSFVEIFIDEIIGLSIGTIS